MKFDLLALTVTKRAAKNSNDLMLMRFGDCHERNVTSKWPD